LSNNLKNHNYYNKIIESMQEIAEEEFRDYSQPLAINIDLGSLLDHSEEYLFNFITIVEKKSKDTLFLKTSIIFDNKIIACATAVWIKEND